jgi:predicted small secreted protein
MKRKLVLVIALSMIASLVFPSFVMAQGDPGLENAIKTVKKYFKIPEELSEFSYSVDSRDGISYWNLSWYTKDYKDSNISATVDSTGDVLYYSCYKYEEGQQEYGRLPKISKAQAKSNAEEIMQKINPGILAQLKPVENNGSVALNDRLYCFEYERIHDGVPMPSNRIIVYIDKQTGELCDYQKSWTKDLSFSSKDNILSLEEAQKAYIKNLGLRLTYNAVSDMNGVKVYLAYSPVYNSSYYIDAETGERFYFGALYSVDSIKMMESRSDGGILENGVVLSPEELAAIEEVSSLLSQEQAEKIARDLKALKLDDTFELVRAGLYKRYPDNKGYNWELYFSSIDEKGKTNRSSSISIDAKTGEIVNFNTYYYDGEVTPKFDKDDAKEAVEKLLNEIQPDKFKETEFNEQQEDTIVYPGGEQPSSYAFSYTRKVNDVLFPDNGIYVLFDAITGNIISYRLTWYDIEFPSVEKVLPIEKIYDAFFDQIGLELRYVIKSEYVVYPKEGFTVGEAEEGKEKNEAKLVYAIKEGKPTTFDANTGVVLNYNAEPYKEQKPLVYTDISNHYAKSQIEILAENGIGLEGPELKPDEKIKQKDFMLLLSQVVNGGYQFRGKSALSTDKETEDLYEILIREGIIKKDEINPEAPLTREDSVQFIIRALKYDKVADLSDIFNCSFEDKDDIDPALIGYVVIAKGLKIVNGSGDYFRPKDELKRADALIIIYNYLKV